MREFKLKFPEMWGKEILKYKFGDNKHQLFFDEQQILQYCMPKNKHLLCELDGDCLFVFDASFSNLQVSEGVFIELTKEQIKSIKDLKGDEK